MRTLVTALTLLLAGPASLATAQTTESRSAEATRLPAGGEPLAVQIAFVVKGAARPSWSRQGDWIAYDKRGSDGYSDVYVARSDYSFDRCLTCDLQAFSRRHAGNAHWHPSGDLLVFQAEDPFGHEGEPYPFLAVPGRNRGGSLWVMAVEGARVFQLTGQQETAYPAHSPRFSFEGDQLAWSERLASSGTWGDWVIRVAEFSSSRGVPRIKDVRTFEPAAQKAFYEIDSFTPDDRGVLFSGNLVEGQPIDGLDLYTIRFDDRHVRQLTKSLTLWDRFAALAPRGDAAVWSSSEGLRRPERPLARDDRVAAVPLDLWVGALDGSWTRRLTGFNDPLSEEYLGAVTVGPSAWSPQGDAILTTVTPTSSAEHSDLFLVSLGESFGAGAPVVQ